MDCNEQYIRTIKHPLTDEEREKIDPVLCAEGLRAIAVKYNNPLTYPEMSCLWGAISLLYGCPSEEWLLFRPEKYKEFERTWGCD